MSANRRNRAFLVTALLVLTTSDLVAQTSATDSARTVRVIGEMLGVGRAPLAGVRIVIASAGVIATSDNTGNFVIERLPAGTHTVEISHPDFVTVEVPRVKFVTGDSVIINATLLHKSLADPAMGARATRGGQGAAAVVGRGLPYILAIDGVFTEPGMPLRPGARAADADDVVAIYFLSGEEAATMYGSRATRGILNIATRLVCPRDRIVSEPPKPPAPHCIGRPLK